MGKSLHHQLLRPFVSPNLSRGLEKNLVQLATRLDRSVFCPHVVSLQAAPPANRATLLTPLIAAGIRPVFLRARHWWQFPWVSRRLSQVFRRTGTQVVQSFLFHANVVSRLAARWAGVPAVFSGIRVAEHRKRWHLRLEKVDTSMGGSIYMCQRACGRVFQGKQPEYPRTKLSSSPTGLTSAACNEANAHRLGNFRITTLGCSASTGRAVRLAKGH